MTRPRNTPQALCYLMCVGMAALSVPVVTAQEGEPGAGAHRAEGVPAPVKPEQFNEFISNSPFTRSLNLSDSLVLTGVATIDNRAVATLMNKETKETYVISETPNSQGWKMVEITQGDEIGKVRAKISISEGEVVTVRFKESELKPGEAKPAAGPSFGPQPRLENRDGDRSRYRGPPEEWRKKMENLSEDQRRKLFEHMRERSREDPDTFRDADKRQKAFDDAFQRVTRDR